MFMRAIALACLMLLVAPAFAEFSYYGPGTLVPSKSGKGQKNRKVFAPKMGFPISLGRDQDAYVNSQVWGVGGDNGPSGKEYASANYSMPWHDNYCEKRGWEMPLCPSGKGHQGVDIRGPRLANDRWSLVAVESGRIEHISAFSVLVLRAANGTRYRYLHFDPQTLRVKRGQYVKQGQELAKMSNIMEYRHATTTHLHFDIEQTVMFKNGARRIYVPPYTSLIVAYRKLKKLPPAASNGMLMVDKKRELAH